MYIADPTALYQKLSWQLIIGRCQRLFHGLPCVVRVELGDGFGEIGGLGPKILFINSCVLVDHQCHHAGTTVLSGIGEDGEATRHIPVDNIVFRPTGCVAALFSNHPIEIAMKWLGCGLRTAAVAVGARVSGQRSEGTLLLVIRGLPIKTILLAIVADEFLRKLIHRTMVVCVAEIFDLSVGHSI